MPVCVDDGLVAGRQECVVILACFFKDSINSLLKEFLNRPGVLVHPRPTKLTMSAFSGHLAPPEGWQT